MNPPRVGNHPRWPLERVLFALAGSVTVVSAVLAAAVSPWFLLLIAFVGLNQWAYVLFRGCPTSMLLTRTCGLRSALYAAPASSETDHVVV